MNGNTAEMYGWTPEGGGGTACLIPIAWPVEACRFAGGGDAAVVSSLTLDRHEGAGANGVSASRAEHLTQSSSLFARRTVAILVPSRNTALPQSKRPLGRADHLTQSSSSEAWRTVPSQKHFPQAAPSTFPDSIPHKNSFLTPPAPIFRLRRLFYARFFRF